MTKIVKNVMTYDAPVRRYSTTRDDLLRAVEPGKLLVMGTCWTGMLKPYVDSKLAELEPLITGFTSGNVLHAQNKAAGELNLGRTWVGDLSRSLQTAVRDASGVSEAPKLDVTEVARAVESVRNALGADPVDFRLVADGIRALRRARDSVLSSAAYGSGNAAEAGTADMTKTADAARTLLDRASANTRDSLAAIRENARKFWEGNSTPTHDGAAPTSVIRDAVHAAHTAKDMRTKIRALNAANSAAWAGTLHLSGSSSSHPIDQHARGNGSLSPADINAAIKAYWAGK